MIEIEGLPDGAEVSIRYTKREDNGDGDVFVTQTDDYAVAATLIMFAMVKDARFKRALYMALTCYLDLEHKDLLDSIK